MDLADQVEDILGQKDYVRIIRPHLKNVRDLMKEYTDVIRRTGNQIYIKRKEEEIKGKGESMIINYENIPLTVSSLFSDTIHLYDIYFLISKRNKTMHEPEEIDEFLHYAVDGMNMDYSPTEIIPSQTYGESFMRLGYAYTEYKVGYIRLNLDRNYVSFDGKEEPNLQTDEEFIMPVSKKLNVIAFPKSKMAVNALQERNLASSTHNYSKGAFINTSISLDTLYNKKESVYA